jgi:hypothetical protein
MINQLYGFDTRDIQEIDLPQTLRKVEFFMQIFAMLFTEKEEESNLCRRL